MYTIHHKLSDHSLQHPSIISIHTFDSLRRKIDENRFRTRFQSLERSNSHTHTHTGIRMMMEFSDVTRAAAAASSSRHRRSRLSRVCDVPTNIARLGHRLIVSHMSTPRARFRRLLRSCVTRHRVQETPNDEREVEVQNDAQQEEQRDIESTEHVQEEDEQDVAHKEEEEEEKEEEIEEKEEEETPPTTRPDYLTRLRNAIRAGQQDIALALAYESPPTLRNNEIVRALLNSDWFGAGSP